MESTYEINAEQLKQVISQLGEIPSKYSANLLLFFAQLQPKEACKCEVKQEAKGNE